MNETLRQRAGDLLAHNAARRGQARRRWVGFCENIATPSPHKSLRELLTEIRSEALQRSGNDEFPYVPFGKKGKAKSDLPA